MLMGVSRGGGGRAPVAGGVQQSGRGEEDSRTRRAPGRKVEYYRGTGGAPAGRSRQERTSGRDDGPAPWCRPVAPERGSTTTSRRAARIFSVEIASSGSGES